jgi:hypothetical protein
MMQVGLRSPSECKGIYICWFVLPGKTLKNTQLIGSLRIVRFIYMLISDGSNAIEVHRK